MQANDISASQCATTARCLYPFGGIPSAMQRWRPHICPFHRLIALVPDGSRVLDVGGGAGLFLGLLNEYHRLSHGYGFDANEDSISLARRMSANAGANGLLRFEHITVENPWPDGKFDVVSMIDVMHHVPLTARKLVISNVESRLKPGGIFIYKDVVQRPRWRAWANQLHDLVIAREWIRSTPMESINRWSSSVAMELEHSERIDMLWYGHELAVYRKAQ